MRSLTMLTLYSPCTVNSSLPVTAMPIALIWFSKKGSSSSTTYSLSTLAANSRMSFSGSGYTMPSFNVLASGSASRTYW